MQKHSSMLSANGRELRAFKFGLHFPKNAPGVTMGSQTVAKEFTNAELHPKDSAQSPKEYSNQAELYSLG